MDSRIKGLFFKAALLLMVCSVFFQASDVSAAPAAASWGKNGNTWNYYDSQGTKMTNCWKQDSSCRWFYLGTDGAMVTNSAARDNSGRWFYLGADGAMVTNRWIYNSGYWYYYGPDGAMFNNRWQQDSSMQWFYLGTDGALVTNCTKQDSSTKWFYLGPDGAMVTNSWEDVSGTHFYFGSDGAMIISSWVETDGKWYYLNTGGDMAFSTVTPDGYTVDENGVRVEKSANSHLRVGAVDITGDTKIGSTLTAGTLTPAAAEVSYQWQMSTDGLAFTNIEGATANTYTIPKGSAGKYFRVSAKGINKYAGTVFSEAKLAERIVLTANALADDKTYDGTAAATGAITLSGVIPGDDVSAAGTYDFNDKTAGSGKIVTVTDITLFGEDADDYTVSNTASTQADINARFLTITATGIDKEYDGSNAATVTLGTDKVSGDDVTANYKSALFDNKNVGTDKTIEVSGISLTGEDADNYTIDGTAAATADITKRGLNVAATGNNRIYDGTTNATVTLSTDKIDGDDVAADYTSASFANKNVGANKTVSVSGITISGTDAVNYNILNAAASANADIAARTLNVEVTGTDKEYDGTATAVISLSNDKLSGDTLDVNYTGAAFEDKNVGQGKTITVSGISISGTDAGNYTASITAFGTADVTSRALTVTATGMDKEYDGFSAATVTLGTDKLANDDVSAEYASAAYDNKNVGTDKIITVSGISISGADAGNYSISSTTETTAADITPKALTASVNSITGKTYDGTASASGTLSLAVVAGSDDVSAAGTFEFGSSNAGNDITVNVTGITLTGTDAGNYTVNSTTTGTGTIAPRSLTATATADDKIYDGTNAATGGISLEGILGTDDVSGAGTFAFGSASAGNNIAVNVTNIYLNGSDAGNYSVNETATANADISVKELTIYGITANDKTYDGTTNATVTGTVLLTGIASGDEGEVTLSGTPVFTFAKADADSGIKINISGLTLSGTKAGNYALVFPELMADITPSTPVVDSWATSTEIVYGQKLSESTLMGGNVLFNGTKIDGTFSFTTTEAFDPSIYVPNAGNYDAAVTFTPESGNFSSLSGNINVKINEKTLTVAADHKTKVYGSADPALTWRITGGSLVEGDELSGALTRTAGEDVGSYAMGQGTLGNSNYSITFVPADMDITPAALTLATPPLAESITYGDSLGSSALSEGTMMFGEVQVEGVFSFTYPDTMPSAGTYKADITFDPTSDNFENYTLKVDVVVNPKPVTITINNQSKTYGDVDPELTYSASAPLVGDDYFTGALIREAGENVGTYQITQGSLALSADYILSFASESKYLTINALSITVTPDNLSKTYGDEDPTLTYTTSVPLVGSDSFTGALTRAPGENVGSYEISRGTLALSSNYDMNLSAATKYMQINKRELAITANDVEKTYGDTYYFTGNEFTSTIMAGTDFISSVVLASDGTDSAAAPGTYEIMPFNVLAGPGTDLDNYSITYVSGILTVNPALFAGHYYEFVYDPGITWQNAEAAASQKSFNGWQGYLATITSIGENDFVKSACQGQGWLGGSDDEFNGEPKDYWEGDWIWATGPEKGHSIYEYGYTNWASGEPNNAGDEDYMHMYGPYDGNAGQWNDYAWNNPYIMGYIVEYGGL